MVRPLKGKADRLPCRVVDPMPSGSVTKLEELTAAHWLEPVQVQMLGLRVVPFSTVAVSGSPVIAQGPIVAWL